ncbi:toll-like receptor 4 [Saccostrea echinata]|uniref:toll-like receptor 4 n=1 Tax=Saccostrea echinata TaxID=191078 RepID=UPI002A7F6E3C|nr:toll-like receptor 4 [Saccostrea echinata]
MLPDDVTYLDLSYNSISTFKNNSFKRLSKLSVLKLNSNSFRMTENLDISLFADLINIKNIDLSDNNELTFQIMPILAYGLQNSTIASLRVNKIHCTFGLGTKIRIKDVRYLKHTNLRELHLSSNRIELVENGVFDFFPETLKRISFADNRLTFGVFALELRSLKGLEWLNGSAQYLTHDPAEFIQHLISPCEDEKEYLPSTHIDKHKNRNLKELQKSFPNNVITEEDMPFVQKMVSELETNNGIRLCIHSRDFVPGYDISENIITAINKSRKTVVILSPNFIKSSWCMYELHIAKMEEIYSRENECVLLLIFYDAVPVDKIPLSIMDLIKQKSYIEFPNDDYGDPNAVSLQKLYLSNNLLVFSLLPDSDGKIFRNLKSLRVVDLKANKISYLPNDVFKNLENLEYLDLSSNLLTGIDFDIRYLKSPQNLMEDK